jgi:hypothetical protein
VIGKGFDFNAIEPFSSSHAAMSTCCLTAQPLWHTQSDSCSPHAHSDLRCDMPLAAVRWHW